MLTVVVEGESDRGPTAKVLAACGLTVDRWLPPRDGKSKLDERLPAYVRASRTPGDSWIVFRDTDGECPVLLRRKLLGDDTAGVSLLLRLAHPEVEAWLLGDTGGIATWLDISPTHVPLAPEALREPKEELLRLALRSRKRDLRTAVVRQDGRTGPRYSAMLNEFALDHWDPAIARCQCPSLDRAMNALTEWQNGRRSPRPRHW